ncbi:IclR family transcriptional regulator domain-containing protein [Halegenticoccus tardaugens]|uniref:IclR family transcriptional regulator domain-containing protein n=1 Tax=Halegenticoccus tardaugens TaxID=2071624 RepID=UPI00100B1D49
MCAKSLFTGRQWSGRDCRYSYWSTCVPPQDSPRIGDSRPSPSRAGRADFESVRPSLCDGTNNCQQARAQKELEQILERRVVFDCEERKLGLHSVAVPIRNGDGGVEAAISISSSVNRMRGRRFRQEFPTLPKTSPT